MKNLKTIASILFIIILIPQIITACSIGDVLTTGERWESDGKTKAEAGYTMDTDKIARGSSNLYNVLLTIATIVAVFVGAVMGIKFMTAGIDKKVQVKESLFPYLISCIVVFGSLGIWKLVVNIMGQVK